MPEGPFRSAEDGHSKWLKKPGPIIFMPMDEAHSYLEATIEHCRLFKVRQISGQIDINLSALKWHTNDLGSGVSKD